MKRYLVLFLLTFAATAAFAQGMDLFCNAGLHPDGYIDLSALPPAPLFSTGGENGPTSAPITVTLPVTGLAGLTVQVTIPALQAINGTGGGPAYTVTDGTLTLGGIPAQGGTTSGAIIVLQFNNPVAGVGLIANSAGRGTTFTLQTDIPSSVPVNFQDTTGIFTLAPYYFSMPIQQVDLGVGFTTASVSIGIEDTFGLPSLANFRVQSTAASLSNLVPKEGLQQWLRSDSAQSPFLGPASAWPDQSGNGHDATQTVAANQPGQVQGDGNACQPAFSFAGNQYFNFNLPIDGWDEMTIFLVEKSSVNPPPGSGAPFAAAILWEENASWGDTFVSPYQTSLPFRFGTRQAGNQPIYTRPVTVGQDFTITRAVHDGSTDSLYVNGLLALKQGGKRSVLGGTSGAGYIGRGIRDTYFHGEISEILIYNRVLPADEAASVESYLRNKFGTR